MTRRGWTPAEQATARTMRAAGETIAAIALAVGRSEDCVRTALHRMGVKLAPGVAAARYAATIIAWRADPANEARRQAGVDRQWTPKRRLQQGEIGRASIAGRLAWCPPAYRADYSRLVRSTRMLAADARRMIEADMARDAARPKPPRRRRTHDELMAAIAAGETVKLTFLPVPQRREPTFSGAGCALA